MRGAAVSGGSAPAGWLRPASENASGLSDVRRRQPEKLNQTVWAAYGLELVAVDGTRIKAVNNRDRNFTRAKLQRHLQRIDEQPDRYLEQTNEADAQDADGGTRAVAHLQEKMASMRKRREVSEDHRRTLDESGGAQLPLTDSDARATQAGTGVGVGYNAQFAVDTRHNLIAALRHRAGISNRQQEARQDMP